MRFIKHWIIVTQILAMIGLGISYFLPFYQSATSKTRYVDEWGLFFWPVVVVILMWWKTKNWMNVFFYLLAIIGGLLDYFLVTFLATYKSTGLVGFDVARISLVLLMFSWFILGVLSLLEPRHEKTHHNALEEPQKS